MTSSGIVNMGSNYGQGHPEEVFQHILVVLLTFVSLQMISQFSFGSNFYSYLQT